MSVSIEVKLKNNSAFTTQVSIIAVSYGEIETIIDGKFKGDGKKHRIEEVIMTFAKYFDNEELAMKYTRTKEFFRIFKVVQKGYTALL